MGKKNRKNRDDEDDYFASLAQASQAAPAEAVQEETAVDKEDEEEEAEMIAAAEAAARAAQERVAAERVAAAERAEKAARARLMMAKRSRKKNKGGEDDEDEDALSAFSPEAREVEAAPREEEEEQDDEDQGAEGEEGDAPTKHTTPEEDVSTTRSLTPFGRALLALRPYSLLASTKPPKNDEERRVSFVVALLLYALWVILSAFAAPATLTAVDAALRSTDGEAAQKLENFEKSRRRDMLFCPTTNHWFKREAEFRADDDDTSISLPQSLRFSSGPERWQKNLKTKSQDRGRWVRARPGDGWASAPDALLVDESTLAASQVRFFALYDDVVFECTAWVASHVCPRAAARDAGLVDAAKPLFSVDRDDDTGLMVARLQPKIEAHLAKVFAASATAADDADGGSSTAAGKASSAKAAAKEKLSRADKKAKKMAYGRR